MTPVSEERASQIFGAIMLIGLGILFITSWWWPGIMFVLGIGLIARSYVQGKGWMDQGGLALIAIGLIFGVGNIFSFGLNWWPLILIGLGLYILFGDQLRARMGGGASSDSEQDKRKNDLV